MINVNSDHLLDQKQFELCRWLISMWPLLINNSNLDYFWKISIWNFIFFLLQLQIFFDQYYLNHKIVCFWFCGHPNSNRFFFFSRSPIDKKRLSVLPATTNGQMSKKRATINWTNIAWRIRQLVQDWASSYDELKSKRALRGQNSPYIEINEKEGIPHKRAKRAHMNESGAYLLYPARDC